MQKQQIRGHKKKKCTQRTEGGVNRASAAHLILRPLTRLTMVKSIHNTWLIPSDPVCMYLFWTWPQRGQTEPAREHQNTLLSGSGPWSCTGICLEPDQGACCLSWKINITLNLTVQCPHGYEHTACPTIVYRCQVSIYMDGWSTQILLKYKIVIPQCRNTFLSKLNLN